MRNGMKWMSLGLGLAMSAGCIGPAPESATTAGSEPTAAATPEATALLRIDVEGGHDVSFYEPMPGGLYMAEHMSPGQSFVLSGKEASDALLAFKQLRPGAPVPEALQAAYERARALPDDTTAQGHQVGGGQPAAAQASHPGVASQGLTSSSSAQTFVASNGGCDWGPQWSTCRVEWGGGYYAYTTGTSALCVVDHYAGNGVTVQITVGSTISSTFQGVGTIAQYSLGAAGASTTRRIDITNAAGDNFHVGCRWGV